MKTFKHFLEQRLMVEIGPPGPAGAPPAPGGLGAPGALPGGAPPPPPGGGGMPPMGGMPPPGGGMPGMGAPAGGGTGPNKLKATNVWDVLEKVLGIADDKKPESQQHG